FCLHLWTRGGDLLDPSGKPSLDTAPARAALEFYRKLIRHSATVPDAKKIDSVAAGNRFMAGEVAMMANWFGFATMCQTLADSAVRGEVGVAPIAARAGGKSAALNVDWFLSLA